MRPRDEADLSAMLRDANRARRVVAASGGATKSAWGAETTGESIDMRAFDAPVAFAPGDFVCVAQAGMRLVDLQRHLRADTEHHQQLMLDPPQGADATLGGIVATNASGPLRHRYGAPRDLLIGARFVLADGTIAKSGGRVVKNVAGYDLTRLLCGSLGTVAVITEVAFRLHPVAAASVSVRLETRDRARLVSFAAAVRRCPASPDTLELSWPAGVATTTISSTPEGADQQARMISTLDRDARVEAAAHPHGGVWDTPGAVIGFGVSLDRIDGVLAVADATAAVVVVRAGVGVGEARVDPHRVDAFCAGIVSLGGHVQARRAARCPLPTDPVAAALRRRVKDAFDPNRILAPERAA
jgi:glycolate oxidase FAD binding subunit